MKPFVAVIANINIVISDVLSCSRNNYPRFIISAHVLGLTIAFLTTPLALFATTVVAVRDAKHNRVIVAADSLVCHRYTPAESRCKIQIVSDDCIFTMAGMYEMQTPKFDLFSFAESACRSAGDLKQRADSFLAAVFPKVAEVVRYLALTDPAYLRENYEGKPVIEVLFLGSYRKQPVVFARGIVLENNRLDPEVDEVTSDDEGFFSGTNDHITTYINTHKTTWRQHGTISAVRHLVEIEADAHPKLVARPISILSIDSQGHTSWIQGGQCKQTPEAKSKKLIPFH